VVAATPGTTLAPLNSTMIVVAVPESFNGVNDPSSAGDP
jgi:hypothetical protein